jgi:hypothetical protein
MKSQVSETTMALLAAAGSVLLVSSCATAPTMSGPAIPPQGATWTSAVTTTGSFGAGDRAATTTMGMGSWKGQTMKAFRGQRGTTFVNSNGCWVGMAAGGKPIFSWNPPICYRYPLAVGDAWTDKRRMTIHQTKRTVNIESSWNVESYDEVTVPAGTFGAYRITYSDNNGTERVDWFSPQLGIWVKSNVTRTAKHPRGPGSSKSVLVAQTIKK